MQDATFTVHLIQLQTASLRDAETMPEHQEQKATVAGFVPAALGRFDQPFHLTAGKVFPVALTTRLPGRRRPVFRRFSRVHHFVESFPCPKCLKPL
jgi:hypothetical protein